MGKSLKNANWGCAGAMCVLLAMGILVMYAASGGFYNRQGKFFKLNVECAVGMSAFFFLLGILGITVSLILRSKRKREEQGGAAGWRRRAR